MTVAIYIIYFIYYIIIIALLGEKRPSENVHSLPQALLLNTIISDL